MVKAWKSRQQFDFAAGTLQMVKGEIVLLRESRKIAAPRKMRFASENQMRAELATVAGRHALPE